MSIRSSVPEAYQVIASCLPAVSYAWEARGDREQTESVLLALHGSEGEEVQEQHAVDAGNMLVSLYGRGLCVGSGVS